MFDMFNVNDWLIYWFYFFWEKNVKKRIFFVVGILLVIEKC